MSIENRRLRVDRQNDVLRASDFEPEFEPDDDLDWGEQPHHECECDCEDDRYFSKPVKREKRETNRGNFSWSKTVNTSTTLPGDDPATSVADPLAKAMGSIIIFMFVLGCVMIVLGVLSIALTGLIIGIVAAKFGGLVAGVVAAVLAGVGAWGIVSGAFGSVCKWVTKKLTGISEGA